MGILNVTPDSFYDGGRYGDMDKITSRIEAMVDHGAQLIDVGGMSSRPGAQIISVDEELKRVIPVVEWIHENYPEIIISIDTVHGKVARETVLAGAHIVNDISAWTIDPTLIDVVEELKPAYILMHMKGDPASMQKNPRYTGVVKEIMEFFSEKIRELKRRNILNIILDPGFGFGKTIEHNYQILSELSVYRIFEYPILCGLSRKSMIYQYLNITPDEALNGTTACHMAALMEGAKILRVHDVAEAIETIKIFDKLTQSI